MIKQILAWQLIAKSLQEQTPAMVLYVLESSGSSPGRQGFCMTVNAAGEMEGSIGGGIMEHKFIEMAKEKLLHANQGHVPVIRKQIHDKTAAKNQSGMICSGEQTIFLHKVQQEEAVAIKDIIASLEQLKNGQLELSPKGIKFSKDIIPAKDHYFSKRSEKNWVYKEKTGYKNHLFIVGGGHCSLAFSQVMSGMDFHIHLYDDRQNLHTMMQNTFAHEKKIVNDYGELRTLIAPGHNHYVVIMTLGYRTDDIALRALLDKDFKYFGLLGSRKKIEKMFSDYIALGFNKERLNRIHSPVGIIIKSETPEEIAVSIAAEIIQVKNTTDTIL